jgi:hypothetical protein
MYKLFFDSSASVISSRIASSATFALKSGVWVFLFAISDRLSHHAIHLNNWSEFPRPPLQAGHCYFVQNCHALATFFVNTVRLPAFRIESSAAFHQG